MPIFILPLPTVPAWGPGIPFQVQSDFIGPLPTGAFWELTTRNHTAETVVGIYTFPALSASSTAQWWFDSQGSGKSNVLYAPQDGDQVDVSVRLMQDSQTELDHGVSSPFPWTSTQFLWTLSQPAIANVQGGFTDQDRTNLTDTLTNTQTMEQNWANYEAVTLPSLQNVLDGITSAVTTVLTGVGGAVSSTIGQLFSGKTFDAITTMDFGSACFPDQLVANLGGGTFFGIQMECTSYAPWYVFKGYAQDYSAQALGTLEITRGGDVILRQGLHQVTHMVYPLPATPFFELELATPVAPGDYVVTITPSPETCWHLSGLGFP